MLWIDKYCPRHLSELTAHPNVNAMLSRLVSAGDLPHLLFYGPFGGGKTTRIKALLRALYGDGVDKVKAEVICPEGINEEFVTTSSAYHVEISVTLLGNKDRLCVQYAIKELSEVASVFGYSKKGVPTYRVFVLKEAENLTFEAQAALRRTLERCVANSRVVLQCNKLSAIIPALRSRCLCLRLPLPSSDEIVTILDHIVTQEQVKLQPGATNQIAHMSEGDIRKAILTLERAAVNNETQLSRLKYQPWEMQCAQIVERLKEAQDPKRLHELREPIYNLTVSLIPPQFILKTITMFMIDSFPNELRPSVIEAAAHYSHTLAKGSKPQWHIEAFLAACMSGYKRHVMSLNSSGG